MRYCEISDTIGEFWECECEHDCIHNKREQMSCSECGCVEEESSDANITAVKDFLISEIRGKYGVPNDTINLLMEIERTLTIQEEQP